MRQKSVSEMSQGRQTKILSQNDLASQEYPSVLIAGHLVHLSCKDGEWELWINCEDADFTGVCIGVGQTRDEALAMGIRVIEAIGAHLQNGAR